MSKMTDILEELVGNHLFRTATWTKPATIYVGLITAVADAETGSVTEVSGSGYARVATGPSDATWNGPVANNKRFGNAAAVTFPAPTGTWGTCTHMGLWDAATAGQLLAVAPLADARTLINGDPAPSFDIDTLGFTFSGSVTDYLVDQIGNHLFRTATWAKPTNLYVALKVASTEVTGGSYARVAVACADTSWSAPSSGDGLFSNASPIVFPVPSAGWGTVDKVSIFDASSSGNELLVTDLTPLAIASGALAPNFNGGALSYAVG